MKNKIYFYFPVLLRFFFAVMMLFAASSVSAQNYNWITPSKTYLKCYVNQDGLYRISKTDFTNAGINPSVIDPRTVKVLNNGVQIPIYFSGEGDGVFNDNDYFDFYAMRNYGGPTITYTDLNLTAYITNEFYNQYSDTNLYYIDWNGSFGQRFTTNNYSTVTPYSGSFFNDTLHFEKDKIYSLGENVSAGDYRYLSTEKFLGEGWYWSFLSSTQSVSDTFSLPGLYTSLPQNASVRIFAYPQNLDFSIVNEHSIEIRVNGNLISTLFRNNMARFDTTLIFSSTLLSAVSVNEISVKYIAAPGFDGHIYFDLFELSYPKTFRIGSDKFLSAELNQADTTSKLFRIPGYNPAGSLNFYDVKNSMRISNYTVSGDTLKFTGKSNARFEIVNDSVRKKPFRIKQRQVPDLVSSNNGADYLLIYNSIFQAQAEQLRTYRQSTDSYRSVKAEIEDIYDIFNYGKEDPVAVRNFVKHAYDNWQTPKLKFINLFGRGSLDPKKNSTASVYEKNLVPVYGNPPSDGYFANMNIGTFCYYPQIAVGRIPAYVQSEAQIMTDKIIAYENEPPDRWWKAFTYITGGSTFNEQQSHQQRSNFEINSVVLPPSISGEGHKIYRNDTSGNVTFNYADSIKNDINRGTLYVNFRGHAGSRDWEVGMQDPNVLNNGNRLPIILSLTCFTGENARTDFRGFGEKFMYLNGKGSIGFLGTTGWSFSTSGNDFGTYIIYAIKNDSMRRMGDFLLYAGRFMSGDSLSFAVRHTLNCYNLLGDPAVKIKLPKIPEFVMRNNDYKLSDESITLNDPVTLSIFPKNFGTYADSCRIRFQIKKNNQNYLTKDTSYKAFRYLDTVLYHFTIDTPGVFTMTVTLDADNFYPGEDNTNNTITFNLPYNEYAFLPVNPVNNSIVYRDSVEFSCLNPSIDFSKTPVRVLLQMDTSRNFNSALLRTFTNSSLSGYTTKFKSSIPLTAVNTVYYWRTNSIINSDSTGWTSYKSFVYKNNLTVSDNRKKGEPVEDGYSNSELRTNIFKYKGEQFSSSELNNTMGSSSGIVLSEYPATLFVRSLGSNGEEASYFSVGTRNVYVDGGSNAGLNLLQVRKVSGNILKFKNFKMTSAQSSDSLVEFLNTFDSTHYLMLLNAAYVAGGTTLSANAKNKLRQFGSIYCDSINLISYFHTWSFIGYLGASSSQTSEMFDPCCRTSPTCTGCDHWSQSLSSMNVVFRKTSGTVSNVIGPAKSWTEFYWGQNIPQGSNLTVDVFGIDHSGANILLKQNLSSNKYTELSSINAREFPKLNIVAKLTIDTLTGMQSPVFNSINVNYSAASELVLDRTSLVIGTLDKNSMASVSFDYHNAGYNLVKGTIVNIYNGPVSDSNVISTDTVKYILKPDSTKNYTREIALSTLRQGIPVYIYIKPKDFANEFYTFNNTVNFTSGTKAIVNNQNVKVTVDGNEITGALNTRKDPEVKINLPAEKYNIKSEDTSGVYILLNRQYVPYFKNGINNPLLKRFSAGNGLDGNNISVDFYPQLNDGNNELSVIYRNNAGENDTVVYELFVTVESSVSEVYNFPNPMRNETSFIFNIEGADPENTFKIKIFTVSGRLIREIEYNPVPGYNQIQWDGRDSDGDILANGTYFYKLVYEGNLNSESRTQKLVILK